MNIWKIILDFIRSLLNWRAKKQEEERQATESKRQEIEHARDDTTAKSKDKTADQLESSLGDGKPPTGL